MDQWNNLLFCGYSAVPQSPLTNVGFQDGGPSIQRKSPTTQLSPGDHPHNVQDPEATCDLGPGDNTAPQAAHPTPIEFMRRDANNDYNLEIPLVNPDPEDKDTEPNRDLDETINEKDHIPEMIHALNPEGMLEPSQQHFGPQTPVTSHGAASDAQVSGGQCIPASCIYIWILELQNSYSVLFFRA